MRLQLPNSVLVHLVAQKKTETHIKQLEPDITESVDVGSTSVSEENIREKTEGQHTVKKDDGTTITELGISSSNKAETKLTHIKQLESDITERADIGSTGVSEENIQEKTENQHTFEKAVGTTITGFCYKFI